MTVYSTCRSCGGVLAISRLDQFWHDWCPPAPTPHEAKLDELGQMVKAVLCGNDHDPAKIDALAGECTDIEDAPPRLGQSALTYAAWGWPVFPLRPQGCRCDGDAKCQEAGFCMCPKKPATPSGFKDATCDPNRIIEWWKWQPQFNIGLATGVCFDAIDVDPRAGGEQSWATLRVKPELPDIHGRVLTANGGFHCYVEVSGSGNRAGILPGIDYRGRGGYVVAPPSRIDATHRWAWSVYPSPVIVPARGGVVPQ